MRVVYVSSATEGGTVTHLQTLAPSVAEQGIDVHVICASESLAAVYRRAGVVATGLGLRHKFDLTNAVRLRPLVRGADIVHTHDRRSGMLARPLARALGAQTVDTYHGLPDELAIDMGAPGFVSKGRSRRRVLAGRAYLRFEAALSRLGLIVVPSRALADFLDSHGFPGERLRVVPYGIDVRRTAPAPPRNPFIVATSAYLTPRKGIDTLIAACSRVAWPLRLEIFGDGPLRLELQQQAKQLGVDARFHGHITNVRDRLGEVDLLVLPTRGDNLPVAVLEAMAAAVPVVATRVGGIPEQVVHGKTGVLVEVDDVEALADAVESLARDPNMREQYARAGARRAAELFDAGAVARRMVGVYEELCG